MNILGLAAMASQQVVLYHVKRFKYLSQYLPTPLLCSKISHFYSLHWLSASQIQQVWWKCGRELHELESFYSQGFDQTKIKVRIFVCTISMILHLADKGDSGRKTGGQETVTIILNYANYWCTWYNYNVILSYLWQKKWNTLWGIASKGNFLLDNSTHLQE